MGMVLLTVENQEEHEHFFLIFHFVWQPCHSASHSCDYTTSTTHLTQGNHFYLLSVPVTHSFGHVIVFSLYQLEIWHQFVGVERGMDLLMAQKMVTSVWQNLCQQNIVNQRETQWSAYLYSQQMKSVVRAIHNSSSF